MQNENRVLAPMRALAIAAVMLSMTWTVEASVAVVPDGDRAVLRDGEGRQLVSFSGVELSVSWMGAAGRGYRVRHGYHSKLPQ